MNDVKSVSELFIYFLFFACECLVLPAPFVEKTVFSIVLPFPLCQKDKLTIFMWISFWDLYSIPFIYFSVFIPITHCLDYCSFRVGLEVR